MRHDIGFLALIYLRFASYLNNILYLIRFYGFCFLINQKYKDCGRE